MRNIISLITGGAGFIGSHVADHLLARGHEVIVLDDLSGGFRRNVNKDARFIEGSASDYELVKNIFKNFNINYVFHFAAYASEGLSHYIRRFNYNNNLIGSINLINESVKKKVECFVFASSIAVYGRDQLPMKEDMTPSPEDPYGISKYAVELDLKAAHHHFGLNYIIFRPHNVYGERQNMSDNYRNVIGIFIRKILRGENIIIFGNGKQTRAFSYIEDIVPVIALAVENKKVYNEVFNIGADTICSINNVAELIMNKMNKRVELLYDSTRKEYIHAYADHTKAREYFALHCKETPLNEGIGKMIKWIEKSVISNSLTFKYPQEFKNIEIYDSLPQSWCINSLK